MAAAMADSLTRVVFDTNVIRGVAHQDPWASNFGLLEKHKPAVQFCVSDIVLAELADQLSSGALSFGAWVRARPIFEAVIDNEQPVAREAPEITHHAKCALPARGQTRKATRPVYRPLAYASGSP